LFRNFRPFALRQVRRIRAVPWGQGQKRDSSSDCQPSSALLLETRQKRPDTRSDHNIALSSVVPEEDLPAGVPEDEVAIDIHRNDVHLLALPPMRFQRALVLLSHKYRNADLAISRLEHSPCNKSVQSSIDVLFLGIWHRLSWAVFRAVGLLDPHTATSLHTALGQKPPAAAW
jgi:hypothetical protein